MRKALIALVLVAAACSGDPATSETTSQATPETTSGKTTVAKEATTTTTEAPPESTTTSLAADASDTSVDSPLAVGRVARIGDWNLRVTSAVADGTSMVLEHDEFNDTPEDGQQYYLVGLEATYVGEDSGSFWVDMTLKSVGASRVAYEPFDSDCGFIPDDINDTGEAFPGGTVTGYFCWAIDSSDADSLVMIAEEWASFDDVRTFMAIDPEATPADETTSVEVEGWIGEEALPVGEVVTVGGWEIRVLSFNPDAEDVVVTEDSFNESPEQGEVYVLTELEATYVGEDSSTFWADISLSALGQSNVAYGSFDASCGFIDGDIDDFGETFTGGTISGVSCWSVLEDDADPLVMIVEDLLTFDEERQFMVLTE
jgi:hypothetical protein